MLREKTRLKAFAGDMNKMLSINIGCTRKSEPLFLTNFLGNNQTEFVKILHTVTLRYYQQFCLVSKKSAANYVSIVKFKTTSQKLQYQCKIMRVINC